MVGGENPTISDVDVGQAIEGRPRGVGSRARAEACPARIIARSRVVRAVRGQKYRIGGTAEDEKQHETKQRTHEKPSLLSLSWAT